MCWQSRTRYRLACSVSMRASAVGIAILSRLARLGVAVGDQEESGREGGGRVEAEHAEPGPGCEGVRLVVHGDDRFAGVHREVGADGALPGLRQERYEDRGHEEHAEEGRD